MIVAAMLTLCSIVMTQTACSHKDNSVNSAENSVNYSVSGICAHNGLTIYLFNMNVEECIDSTPVTINLNGSTLKGSPINERTNAYDLKISSHYLAFYKRVRP